QSAHADEPLEPVDPQAEEVDVIPIARGGSGGTDPLVPAEVVIEESAIGSIGGGSSLPPPLPTDVGRAGEGGGGRRELMKSAALVSIGNLGSSLMGMVRQVVVSATGAAISGPFIAALRPVQAFYDLLVNGSVSGALIPTFNDYAAPEKRDEFHRIVFTLVNLVLLIALAGSIVFYFISPWFVDAILVPYF